MTDAGKLAQKIADLERQISSMATRSQITQSTVNVVVDGEETNVPVPAAIGRGVQASFDVVAVRKALADAKAELERSQKELDGKLDDAALGLEGAGKRLTDAEQLLEETFGLANGAVTKTVDQYAISDSDVEPPSTGWSATVPERASGKYTWRRTFVTRANGDTEAGIPAVVTGSAGESAAVLRIDSSRGVVFKNSEVATVLTVTVFYGSVQITDVVDLQEYFGPGAYLEWQWRRMDDSDFGVISSSDSRLSRGGFALTVTAADVATKTVFQCVLNT